MSWRLTERGQKRDPAKIITKKICRACEKFVTQINANLLLTKLQWQTPLPSQMILRMLFLEIDVNFKCRLLNPPKAIPLSFDLGNLTAFDPNPLSKASLANESSLQSIARDSTQLLINEILNLPRTRSTEGIFIQLPASTTPLPVKNLYLNPYIYA